jgi:very-short-patch-repair endonuclease
MSLFICQFCGSGKVSQRSLKNHSIRCKDNPDRKVQRGAISKPAWNKGLKAVDHPRLLHSDETKRKLSEIRKINNPMFIEENRTKVSIGMKKAHSEGRAWNIGKSRWNNELSYPEKFFVEVIENEFQDKEYKNEFPIGIYSADFCWPHLKKVIEIDGDQHQRFEEYIERDKRKDEFLTSQGYQILRIVWKEMFHNPKDNIKKCYEFIHSS